MVWEMSIKFFNQLSKQVMEHAYQPIWKLDSWDICGYEALLRFNDESWNNNLEEVFEKVRQEGQLYELETLLISRAISSFPFFQVTLERLFINIFPSTLVNEKFELFIEDILNRYPQARGKIVFEINESKDEEYIWRMNEFKAKLFFLKEKNFYIAFDDIGKGAASLQKIIEFSPDMIKLDRYFARGLAQSMEKQQLLSLLVEYSNERMTLILEGIEKEMDLAIAKLLRVPVVQGFLLGRPELLRNQGLFENYRKVFDVEDFTQYFPVLAKDR